MWGPNPQLLLARRYAELRMGAFSLTECLRSPLYA